jgi:hypothetical protein
VLRKISGPERKEMGGEWRVKTILGKTKAK